MSMAGTKPSHDGGRVTANVRWCDLIALDAAAINIARDQGFLAQAG
jgi:hypothetical protein